MRSPARARRAARACTRARSTRNATTRAAVVALCAVVLGCGDSQPESAARRDGSSAGVDTPVTAEDTVEVGAVPASCEDLHATMLKVAPTRQAFAAEFGAPDSIARSTEPNRHDPAAIDSLFTVYYPRLVLDIRTPAGARDMATHVRVEDNRYLAYPGIGIGAAASRVEEVLGEPRERGPGSLTYQCGMGAEQPVTFSIANGRVGAVDIAWYVD
jgi:hypothetical protein